MYRQIKINPDDTRYQLIYWGDNPAGALNCYKINTVTYGTTEAPYLTVKRIQTLADQNVDKYPLAARATKEDFYVDDLMTGSDDLLEAVSKQNQLINMLKSAGFQLRKWCANHLKLLINVPPEDIEPLLNIRDGIEDHVKTLGVTWLPKADEIAIKTLWVKPTTITKRTILSDVAHIFDPIGLVSPVIIQAKIFIQELWKLKIDWDVRLDPALAA